MNPVNTLLLLELAADGQLSAAAQQLRPRLHVIATLPPRLLVVQQTPDTDAQPGTVPLDHPTPPLTEAEQLFAAAWATQGRKSTTRPGDGLDWDAPGFTPPG